MLSVSEREAALRQTRRVLMKARKAEKRQRNDHYARAMKIALAVFVRDAPDTNNALWYFVIKCPSLLEEKQLDMLQDEVEKKYLDLSLEAIVDMINHHWGGSRSILDEAARFHMDVQAYQFIAEMNQVRGIAPSYQMTHDYEAREERDGYDASWNKLKSSHAEAVKKAGQRLKHRMGLFLGKIIARPVLPRAVISEKVAEWLKFESCMVVDHDFDARNGRRFVPGKRDRFGDR